MREIFQLFTSDAYATRYATKERDGPRKGTKDGNTQEYSNSFLTKALLTILNWQNWHKYYGLQMKLFFKQILKLLAVNRYDFSHNHNHNHHDYDL